MWPLLAVRTEHEQTGVILLGEEFEAGGIAKRVDRVGFGKLDGERLLESVKVLQRLLHYLRRGAATEEQRLFRVLDVVRRLFLEGSFRAGIARFSGNECQ